MAIIYLLKMGNQIVEATNICNAIITVFYALGACRKVRQITPWELVVKYVKLRLGYTWVKSHYTFTLCFIALFMLYIEMNVCVIKQCYYSTCNNHIYKRCIWSFTSHYRQHYYYWDWTFNWIRLYCFNTWKEPIQFNIQLIAFV